eukprot:7091930-Alexandrium_andersonii.AAC.1
MGQLRKMLKDAESTTSRGRSPAKENVPPWERDRRARDASTDTQKTVRFGKDPERTPRERAESSGRNSVDKWRVDEQSWGRGCFSGFRELMSTLEAGDAPNDAKH